MNLKSKHSAIAKLGVGASLIALSLAGCGQDKNSPPAAAPSTPPTLGVLITPSSSTPPVTVFNQTIAAADGDWTPFPGQANYWDISPDFSLSDGYDDQFDGAMQLTVATTGVSSSAFPYDQSYSELTFYTPTVGTADGLVVATVTDGVRNNASLVSGTYSAALGSVSDARLQRTVDVTGFTGAVTLNWNDTGSFGSGSMNGEPASTYQVVLRDSTGVLLSTLFTSTGAGLGAHSVDITPGMGDPASRVLSFERFGSVYGNSVSIDDVSVVDGAANLYVTNGDFETGNLSGWTVNSPQEIQNMTSGVRTLEGLDVKRSFYTVPNKKWARWVDVFENNTASSITRDLTYATNLGSDGSGIIYLTPGTSGKALTSWDGSSSDRDVGIVFGSGATVPFTSDTGLGDNFGNDQIDETRSITVPAGGRVAVVHFIVMNGTDTGQTATDITALATDIDTVVKDIVDNFRSDIQYRNGMTQQQIDAIINF